MPGNTFNQSIMAIALSLLFAERCRNRQQKANVEESMHAVDWTLFRRVSEMCMRGTKTMQENTNLLTIDEI